MVPIRLTTLTKTGLHRRGPAYPLQTPYDTSLSLRRPRTYDFHQTSHRWPRSVGFPLREPWYHTARPLSLRCRVPFVRAPGLDFHLLSVGHAVRTHRRGYLALRARAPTSMSHGATTRASRVRYEAYIPSPRLLGTPRDWLRQCSRNARPSCDGSFASRFLLAQRFEMRPAKHGVRRHRPHASIRKCQARGVAAARLHSGGSHLAADNRDSSGLRPLWDYSRHGSARRCRARGNKATRHLPRGWLHRADWPGC